MRNLTLTLVTLMTCASCASDPGTSAVNPRHASLGDDSASHDPRVGWLKQHANALRSIDPTDDDFTDLEPRGAALHGVRIVMLGEGSHAAGSAILAKARLVQFLHRELGFDVLAIESGLYDVAKSDETLRAGGDPLESVQLGVFAVWTGTAEFQPVIEYVARAVRSRRPLELAGFDSQLSGRASKELMIPELRQYMLRHGLSRSELDDGSPFVIAVGTRGLPDSSFARSVAALDRLIARAADSMSSETKFWRQAMQSLGGHAESHLALRSADHTTDSVARNREWMRAWNARDEQMARNLLWLANERYRGRKIIVWASTAHVAYSGVGADAETGSPSVPMGALVREAIGNEVYAVGITAYEGDLGNPRWPGYRKVLCSEFSSVIGFEELMHAAGNEFAFVNFRRSDRSAPWLHQQLAGRFLNHESLITSWPRVLDGAIYVRDMRPATASVP
jgi:erythromycin esterase